MESILKKAIEHYGRDAQCMVAVEELAELQKEISKFTRGQQNAEAITEEIADVYIVIDQIRMMAGISEADIGEMIERKVNRLKKRMEEDGNGI